MNTLTTLFDWLVTASIRASLLSLVVLAVQAALGRQLGARARYALWLPVLVVLLMPVLPQSRWSIQSMLGTAPSPRESVILNPTPHLSQPAPVSAATVESSAPLDWSGIFALAWLLVALLVLVAVGVSLSRTLRVFRRSRIALNQDRLAEIDQLALECGLKRPPEVWCSSAITSPAVTGLWRPVLLLPADFEQSFTSAEARLILRHELMHLKRHDLVINALLCLLMALHWFNPLLWLAFVRARLDREAACDAQVLHKASPQSRIEYGQALLKAETSFTPLQLSLGFVGLFQRGSALRSRIHSIINTQPPHPAMKLITLASISLMTFLGVTRAAPPAPATAKPGHRLNTQASAIEYLENKLQKIVFPEVKFQEASLQQVIDFLREKSPDFDPSGAESPSKGVNIIVRDADLNPSKITLQLKQVTMADALRYVTELSGTEMRVEAFAVIVVPKGKLAPRPAVTAPQPPVQPQLGSSIILPNVVFSSSTLDESLEFVRVKARELDPAKKGINIVQNPGATSSAKITLNLRNVPVNDALRYITSLAGLKLSTEGNTFIVEPMK